MNISYGYLKAIFATALVASIGGCASAPPHIARVEELDRETCLATTVEIVSERNRNGQPSEEISREVIESTFNNECSQHERELQNEEHEAAEKRIRQEMLEAQRLARINGASAVLVTALKGETADSTRYELLKHIIERLDSDDDRIRQSQEQANSDAALDAQAMRAEIRRYEEKLKVTCRETTTMVNGTPRTAFVCN